MQKIAKKYLFNVAGFTALLLGFIGIFLPVLPTTPFVILAAFCFSKGSDRFYYWLLNHKLFGPPIADWQKTGSIRTKYKLFATSLIFLSSLFVLSKETIPIYGKIGYLLTISITLIYIWTRPSR